MPASLALDDVSNAAAPTLISRSPLETETQVLRSVEELEAFASQWRALWTNSDSSPFQSPDWLIPFAEHSETDLRVLLLRKNRELIALAPFYIWRDDADDRTARKLLLLGSGISDYLDVIVRPGCERDSLHAIRSFLRATQHKWDRCDLTQLPSTSPLLALGAPSPTTPCPQLSLTHKSLANYAPPHQLENLRYYQRRASKQGALNFIRAAPENCAALMQKLFDLHRARWNHVEKSGVLLDPRLQHFHLDAATRMARSGTLRLYAATLNSMVIAVLYAFASHQRTCYYLSGFDPKYDKLSPGTLLIGHAIEEAIRESHHTFDFLRGQEPYKYKWGGRDRPTHSISIESRSLSASPI